MKLDEKIKRYLLSQRQALLAQVDAIEVLLGIERTSHIRKKHKEASK